MKRLTYRSLLVLRRFLLQWHLFLLVPLGIAAGLAASAHAEDEDRPMHQSDIFATTAKYVVNFYSLWFTYNQSQVGLACNRLIGPDRISPIYQSVVAINDDTLYASTFLQLADQPVIVTFPPTNTTFSLLTLDPFGNVFQSGIPEQANGTFALVGPDFNGALPSNATPIHIPYNTSSFIIRVDKYSPTGENQTSQAEMFRTSLSLQALCDYLNQPCTNGAPHDVTGGAPLILPEIAFATPYKTIADTLATRDPIEFLKQLQLAVQSTNTPPLPADEAALSKKFDGDFDEARKQEFSAATRAAHRLILERYLTHTGPTNWVRFRNIGSWGDRVVERASITEFIQYGNDISAAAYYHVFQYRDGVSLNGGNRQVYVLTFAPGQIPEAKRFWSITAYTPQAIELIPNRIDKYVVASYTPGLKKNNGGSLSVYLSATQPPGIPTANWLPVPNGLSTSCCASMVPRAASRMVRTCRPRSRSPTGRPPTSATTRTRLTVSPNMSRRTGAVMSRQTQSSHQSIKAAYQSDIC